MGPDRSSIGLSIYPLIPELCDVAIFHLVVHLQFALLWALVHNLPRYLARLAYHSTVYVGT